ncbi:hypothetical protein [Sorangium sp. So ce1389]|uniref:hypothetical protein n=1 Tax=Sorangium sp. So ce1389 TaxID=3133336 RepID=UPI003F633627
MHIIFTSETEANEFLTTVNNGLGYPLAAIDNVTGEIAGWTTTWDTLLKHPERDEWAVTYAPEIDPWMGDHVAVELDESWFPPVWIPPG